MKEKLSRLPVDEFIKGLERFGMERLLIIDSIRACYGNEAAVKYSGVVDFLERVDLKKIIEEEE